MDASEIHANRLNAKEVILPGSGENYRFSVEDRAIKLSGGDQELRTAFLLRNQPIRRENHQGFLGESERSSPTNHFRIPTKHDMISGSFRETSHAAITLNQE